MRNRIILILITVLASASISADGWGRTSDIKLLSSYIIPVENADFNSSLTVGIGAEVWGIFELSAHGYLEVVNNRNVEFFEKFRAPEVFSAGVGANIPLGGFSFKADYQRFFSVASDYDRLSISQYTDSYKIGLGIDVNHFLELEVYQRTFYNSYDYDIFDEYRNDEILIGIGANFKL